MKKTFKRQSKTLNRKSKKRTMKAMKGGAKVKPGKPDGSQLKSFGDSRHKMKGDGSEYGIKQVVSGSLKPSINSNKYSIQISELEKKILETEEMILQPGKDRKINNLTTQIIPRFKKGNFLQTSTNINTQRNSLIAKRKLKREEANQELKDMQAKLAALKEQQKAQQKLSNAAVKKLMKKTLGLLKNK